MLDGGRGQCIDPVPTPVPVLPGLLQQVPRDRPLSRDRGVPGLTQRQVVEAVVEIRPELAGRPATEQRHGAGPYHGVTPLTGALAPECSDGLACDHLENRASSRRPAENLPNAARPGSGSARCCPIWPATRRSC